MSKKKKGFLKKPTTVLDASENKLVSCPNNYKKGDGEERTSISLSSVNLSTETKPENQRENEKPPRFLSTFSIEKTKAC